MIPSRITKAWRHVTLTLLIATLCCFTLGESHASSSSSQSAAPSLSSDSPKDVREHKGGRSTFGLVLDPDGKAVLGASVSLSTKERPGRRVADDAVIPVGISAEQGLAQLPPTEPGIYDLTVAADGYVTLTIPGVPVDAGEGPCDLGTIWLEPGIDLMGRVIDPQGRPLAGAKLTVRHRGTRTNDTTDLEPVLSDRQGRFVFVDQSPEARLDLTVELDGYAPNRLSAVTPGEPVELILDPVLTVSGYVLEAKGPVAGAEVRLTSSHQSRDLNSRSVVSQSSGDFELLDVAPGTLRFEVNAPEYLPFTLEKKALPQHNLTDLEFFLKEGLVLAGRVTSKRGPVSDVELVVRTSTDATDTWPRGQSTDDGHFRIAGIPPGDFEILAQHVEFPSIQRPWNIQELGDFIELELSDGVKVSGTVVGPTGEPVPGAQLHWYEVEGPEWRQVASDHDGNFALASLTPAQYRVRVRADGFGELEQVTQILPSGHENLQLSLPMATAIVGRVSGLDLEDLGRLSIRAQRQGAHRGPVQTNYEGMYRLDNLDPGTWWVRARLADGLRELEKTVHINSTGDVEIELDFEFESGLELSGQVSIDQHPAAGLRIALFSRSQAPGRVVHTDHQGRFQIAGLSPALYRLELRNGEILEAVDLDLVNDHQIQLDFSSKLKTKNGL